jgi:heptosyltransferase-1
MPDILLVKTSSLGDVVHNLPVATDIAAALPGARIDWLVEEAYADIPRLHPAVREVFPVAARRWRRALLRRATWREIGALRRRLAARRYDAIVDTQGLLKSAWFASWAHGPRHGYDTASAREPLASRSYARTYAVPRALHAARRNRALAAQALGYAIDEPGRYGIVAPPLPEGWSAGGRHAVLLHGTARAEKLWPERHWIELGRALSVRGLTVLLPWGGEDERRRAERLAAAIVGARVLARQPLAELAAVLGAAVAVAGVDTGLLHLASALGRPAVGIYVATDPALNGIYPPGESHGGLSLGGIGAPPQPAEVLAALERLGA